MILNSLMLRENSNGNLVSRYAPPAKRSLSILEPGCWIMTEAIKDYNVELNKEAAEELSRGRGAGNKIRFEVKEKQTEEGGKTKMAIRRSKTIVRLEKGGWDTHRREQTKKDGSKSERLNDEKPTEMSELKKPI